ncbi:MAG: flagellar hook-associated protein FlgL [Proteobacteria bacterium]|nr:flagellar hook-associated protein FlgL [Pseudomonadota bacterium]HQR05002.1 flagellar hook-associated protein FlgL [Rhodocyclaceae bacterium]
MRISTQMIFDAGLGSMQNQTSALIRTQQQISSGKRILNPADDPVASAQALDVTQAQSLNQQYQNAQGNAQSILGLADSQLSSVNDLYARIKELTVQAGNASLSDSDRRSIAIELRSRYEELIGLANSTDGTGQYLFSGYQGATQPFAGSVENGVVYNGDSGQRTLSVSASRQLSVSDSGNALFMGVPNGNGTFATGLRGLKSANASQATFEGAAVSNPPTSTGTVDVRFWTDTANAMGGGANKVYYDLVNTVTGNSLYTGTPPVTGTGGSFTHPYVSGSPIPLSSLSPPAVVAFDYGANAVITGTPQTGDLFTFSRNAASLTLASSTLTASSARTAISTGTVTDPVKWSSNTNSGNLEVRFWVDGTGSVGPQGRTYYDLVDAGSGKSLFTGNSSATGAGGSYTHAYTSGSPINFNGLAAAYNPPSNDFGASVIVSGIPASGDSFTVKASTDPAGNGYFVTAAKEIQTANTGSAIVGTGTVTDSAKWRNPANSGDLEIRFWKDPQNTAANAPVYYDIVDARTEKSLFTNSASTAGGLGSTYTHAFTAGDGISFSGLAAPYGDLGISVAISGTPASGDAFTVQNSTSTSIFQNLGDLIGTLEGRIGPPGAGNSELQNKLGFVLTNLDQARDAVLKVRADIGTRMGEASDLTNVSQSLNLQYSSTLSNLQDVDYAKAITDFMRQQTGLQAAQQTFSKVSGLSLFNYL